MVNPESNVPPESETYWAELAGMDPDDVCKRAICTYDSDAGEYHLCVLNEDYTLNPKTRTMCRVSEPLSHHECEPGARLLFVSLYYLTHAKEVLISEEWTTGERLEAGAFFFRGPHALPTERVEEEWGTDLNKFCARANFLGGKKIKIAADATYRFEMLPRIPVLLGLWVGDDEFPPRAQFLFDPSIVKHFTLDVVLYTCNYLIERMIFIGGDPAAHAHDHDREHDHD
ncbi:MAG: DUF3786 domain-containing protein [Planctomycetota bacterium]|nr:MAG: DUF3786 domain-containing protein [Planctomycetota bacterium]